MSQRDDCDAKIEAISRRLFGHSFVFMKKGLENHLIYKLILK